MKCYKQTWYEYEPLKWKLMWRKWVILAMSYGALVSCVNLQLYTFVYLHCPTVTSLVKIWNFLCCCCLLVMLRILWTFHPHHKPVYLRSLADEILRLISMLAWVVKTFLFCYIAALVCINFKAHECFNHHVMQPKRGLPQNWLQIIDHIQHGPGPVPLWQLALCSAVNKTNEAINHCILWYL